jgi:hypothetical protein
MKRIFYGAAIAAFSFSGTAALSQDANRPPVRQSVREAQIECYRQYGSYDETKKKWVIPAAPYYIMNSRIDAINNCVAQRTGRPPEGFLREQTLEGGRMYR